MDQDAVRRRMAALPDDDLRDVVTRLRHTYRPEAIEIAEAELASRDLSHTSSARSTPQGSGSTEGDELPDRAGHGTRKVGEVLVTGIIWVLVVSAIGWFGLNLAERGGLWNLIGWAVALPSFALAGLAIRHLVRVFWGTKQALRLMERDPETFAHLKRRYEDAVGRAGDEDRKAHVTASAPISEHEAGGVDVGQFFCFMNYGEHYAEPLADVPNRDAVIAELFLFRAWATQFGFRLFTSRQEESEKLLGEVVNLARSLGRGFLRELEGVHVEQVLGGRFMELLEERWQAYDQRFLKYKDQDPPIPTRMIVAQLTQYCDIQNPKKFIWFCVDFVRLLKGVKQEASRVDGAIDESQVGRRDAAAAGEQEQDLVSSEPLWGVSIEEDGWEGGESVDMERVGEGRYRLLCTPLTIGDEDPPLQYGDVLELERLSSTTFRYVRRVEVGKYRHLSRGAPSGLLDAEIFQQFSDRLHDAGGEWEVLFGGILWVHVPSDAGTELETMLDQVLADVSSKGERRGPARGSTGKESPPRSP